MVMEWVVLSFKRLANCQIGLKHLWFWSGFCCLSLLFIFKIVLKKRSLSLPLVEKSRVNLWSYPFNPLKKKGRSHNCQVTNVRPEIKMRLKQGCQYRIWGRIGLATGTIYFGYRSILVYRFGFIVIFYIYKYIYIYICMYVCVCVYIYYNKYKSLP